MPDSAELPPWSSLSETERNGPMLADEPVLEAEAPTCSFERSLERMQAFSKRGGAPMAGAEIRSPGRGDLRA